MNGMQQISPGIVSLDRLDFLMLVKTEGEFKHEVQL